MQAIHTAKRITRRFLAASPVHHDEAGDPIRIKILEPKLGNAPRRPALGATTQVIQAVSPRGVSDDVVRTTLAEQLAYDSGRRYTVPKVHKVRDRVWKVIIRVLTD